MFAGSEVTSAGVEGTEVEAAWTNDTVGGLWSGGGGSNTTNNNKTSINSTSFTSTTVSRLLHMALSSTASPASSSSSSSSFFDSSTTELPFYYNNSDASPPPAEAANPFMLMSNTCDANPLSFDFSQFEFPYRIDTWKPITWWEVLEIVAYIITFLVSIVGNILVILVVRYNRNMRSSTNQYLVNLAVADLLVTLVCKWVHLVRHLSHPHYVLPAILCKMEGFVQSIALVASVFTLTVISIGRFVAIMFPLHARTSPDRAIRVIAAVWIASALISSPPLLYRGLYKTEWSNFTTWNCDEFFPTKRKFVEGVGCVVTFDAKRLFYMVFIITCYFLPVTIMLVNYSLIVWKLWGAQQPGEQHQQQVAATRNMQRVVRMVTVVLVVFVICWTPLQSLMLYNFIYHEHLPEWPRWVEFTVYFVANSNSALNPIIYCGFNANFRQGLVALLTCRQTRSGSRTQYPSSRRRVHHRLCAGAWFTRDPQESYVTTTTITTTSVTA
ncbi:QRFP-like peptide receptor isoform X3 [Eriocheir sinensis]|uniref:QRFP-like peptide receptor isoform X3 n=1 Tax=Eriocheir sinensis TaxID=95602 RepID=UPI0021C6FE14|nr:QRFP-like peptide receptor isoform X3 [Eriocheir sinensis]